jgi:hypothetical protein
VPGWAESGFSWISRRVGCWGLETRHLESRAKAAARLDLEVSAGWVSLSSRDLWGGDTLLLSTASPLEPEPERFVVTNPRN